MARQELKYRTRAIITRGLYIFYGTPFFSAVYNQERHLRRRQIYAIAQESNLPHFLGDWSQSEKNSEINPPLPSTAYEITQKFK
jgi:hypothetical protein